MEKIVFNIDYDKSKKLVINNVSIMQNQIEVEYSLEAIDESFFECGGVKWMRHNLGAKSETDYGLYYPWGGTKGYEDGSECKFSTSDSLSNMLYGKSETQLKEMGIIDDNGNLTPEYDAVTQALGNGWRMPTIDDLRSLLVNTDLAWSENFNGSGVSGAIFFLKDRSDYLFIPASGYIFREIIKEVSIDGYFWTSNAYSYSDYARCLKFKQQDTAFNEVECRCIGLPIRGVKKD